MKAKAITREPSSFRDNRGYVYWSGGQIFRAINTVGAEAYDLLMTSGLYEALTSAGLLIAHKTIKDVPAGAHKAIAPQLVPVVTYPYEWSFSQLKDAALATLRIQELALKHGLVLRDASAYNIQFVGGKPCLIDTLSFDVYTPGEPWIAYRQFCQHFLAPLALMSHTDIALSELLRNHIDGIPLPLAAKLLPASRKWRGGLGTHITLHARFQRQYQSDAGKTKARRVSETAMLGILASLQRTIGRLKLPVARTEWGAYYTFTNYSDKAFAAKGKIVESYLKKAEPKQVLDLGANNGNFSRIATKAGAFVISSDIDPLAVEANYQRMRANNEANLLPLLVDLTNPSPDLGWANSERQSFTSRAKSDCVMSLALIHHLAISNNLPLEHVAQYFAELGPWLIMEFVPKTDSQVKILLASREDIFPDYTPEGFEVAFKKYYKIVQNTPVSGSERTLYLLKHK